MWELDHKESCAPKNWCFWTVVLEKTLESPLDCREIQPVHSKRNQSWIFIGRTDVEAETPILWPRDAKNWLIGKDPNAGKDWRWEEKGMTEDEIVGRHQQLNGHEFEQTPGDSGGRGSLKCHSPWACKESDTTWRLNKNRPLLYFLYHLYVNISSIFPFLALFLNWQLFFNILFFLFICGCAGSSLLHGFLFAGASLIVQHGL